MERQGAGVQCLSRGWVDVILEYIFNMLKQLGLVWSDLLKEAVRFRGKLKFIKEND